MMKYPFLILNNTSRGTETILISNAGVYEIRCHDCKRFHIGETSRNLNVRIYEHKNDFKMAIQQTSYSPMIFQRTILSILKTQLFSLLSLIETNAGFWKHTQ